MKIMRNIVARVFIYFIFVLISLVALGGVATAAGPSNGTYLKDVNDVQVPQWVTAPDPNNPVFSGRCTDSNGTNWSAGQSAWISTQSGAWFTEQSVTVAAGTTSVPLNVVFANTWCESSRYNALGTYNLIESVSATKGATVSGIAANTVIAAGQPSQPFSLGWTAVAVAALPFNLNLPANLSPGRHDIVVTLNSGKKINSAQDTKKNTYYYQCVKNSPSVYPGGVAPSDFSPCLTGPAELVVTINVPQPNYLGQIQTLKYDTATGVLATDQSMKNARTYIEPCGAPAICSNEGSSNWLTGIYMWVYSAGQNLIGDGAQNIHSSKIVVPPGYRVNNAQLIRNNNGNQINVTPTTTADGKLLCGGTNNTGTCSIGTKVWNQDTTFVQWFLEKIPPTLNVSCISDNPTTGGKITVTASSPLVTNPVISERYDSAAVQNRTLNAGSYTFDIASKYRDGNDHTYYATYDGLSKSITFGPNQLNCKIDKWFYPWLQTSQGDVVADGKIEGQTTSTGTAGTLGARLDNAAAKEAEFLVISAVGGGGPFCSTYKYILTNTSSQGTDCGNGAGYNFNSTGIDNDTVDRVIGGVKQAFADNGNNANPTPSACSASGIATATVTAMPAKITTDCTGGVIYKLSSSTLGATEPTKGRATIFVDGNLTITANILSDLFTAQADPRLAQTLAIVVNGDINIASTVGFIDAQLYSAKKINTCTTSAGNLATANECSIKPLKVKGSLSAKTGFDFKRTFIDNTSSIPTLFRRAAESIKMSSIALAFPPPGLDSRYFYNNFSSYKLDSAEYNPRF